MARNPLIRRYDKKVNGPLLNKSAGILEDYDRKIFVATKEGTITKVPTDDNDIANKAYVDSVAGGGGAGLWEVDGAETQLITPDAIDMQSEDIINTNTMHFDAIVNPAHSEGRLYYSDSDKSLNFYNDEAGTTLNIGEETRIRVRNTTGSTIPDFSPVYQTGSIGKIATIALAQGDTEEKSDVIGITTHSIENNTEGYIIINGVINDIDADGSPYGESWTSADNIWIDANTPGALTNVKPLTTYATHIGHVLNAQNDGSFMVKLHTMNIILDEDDMTSNSATQPATQQSVKAYVDNATSDVAANTSARHAESHTILSHSDTTATGAELDTLTGGGDTTLHDHDGISENTTHRSSDGSDHADVVTNSAKVSFSKTNVKATINHGATSGTTRPSGFDSVEWIGTVEPTNATNDDTWIDTT